MKHSRHKRIFMILFLSPALILFSLLVAIPGVRALVYSLQKWDGLTEPEWIGLENFVRMAKESDVVLVALWHNVIIMIFAGSITLGLALLYASLLHRRIRGANLFRIAFFFPNVLALVAISILWILLYSPTEFGFINSILLPFESAFQKMGIELPIPFLDSVHLIISIIPMMIWTWTGFYMVLFLAAMEGIPEEYYEAAKLDGASGFQQFRYITFPMIREVFSVGIVFLVITTLKFFDPIWVMENQRPNRDSHVLASLMYEKVFTEYNVGYGSAIAVLLFVLVFVATLISLRLSRAGQTLEY